MILGKSKKGKMGELTGVVVDYNIILAKTY